MKISRKITLIQFPSSTPSSLNIKPFAILKIGHHLPTLQINQQHLYPSLNQGKIKLIILIHLLVYHLQNHLQVLHHLGLLLPILHLENPTIVGARNLYLSLPDLLIIVGNLLLQSRVLRKLLQRMVKLGIGAKSVVMVMADGLLLTVLLSILVSHLRNIKLMFLSTPIMKINLVLGVHMLTPMIILIKTICLLQHIQLRFNLLMNHC